MVIHERYNHLNTYYKAKFGERVLKICVDGNFSCPNRDGSLGYNGCIFCSENGSGEHLKKLSIENQVKTFLASYRGQRANKFIVYFQNFSNTYDSIDNLKNKYDSALCDDKIIGLSVATRPDCINENVAKLLSSYKNKYYVSVELGLQTSNDLTGKLINRCYSTNDFVNATNILKKYDIDVICHIMIGLPSEGIDDIKNTIDFVNSQKIDGIKIHSTYIVKNTELEKMFLIGDYSPLTLDEYVKNVSYVISHLRKDIIIHRISGDAPKDLLVAPEWNSHKKIILNAINKELELNNIFQGSNYMR